MSVNDFVNPMDAAHSAPRCQHIKINGKRCGAPAVRSRRLCHFHSRVLRRRQNSALPLVEDATSLQFAIMKILRALENGTYDPHTCGVMLYGLQIASSNLKHVAAELPVAFEEDNSLAAVLLRRLGIRRQEDDKRETAELAAPALAE